jgi:putative ABC transport system permease protein
VVIDQTMAQQFWKDEDVLGKRLTMDATNWLTVVGVVGAVRHRLDEPPKPTLYVPHPINQRWPNWMTVTVRSRLPVGSLIPMLRAEVKRADPNLPVAEVQTIEKLIFQKTLGRRLIMFVLQLFSITTLIIAAIGIYGIVAQSVVQRTREIGIRIAIGATRFRILGFFVGKSLRVLTFALFIGVGGAIALSRFLGAYLYDISRMDLPTFVFASGLMVIVALIASYIPARRAAKVDPIVALRHE